jgi:hypothetical protein
MRKHVVVFVDTDRHQPTNGRHVVERVEEEPLMPQERHEASIIEFEHFNSVKASSRRRTPVAINASTWALTFSTPASANTTGALAERVALCLLKSRNADRIHFEARKPRVVPRRTTQRVLQRTRRAAVIHRTTDVLNGRLVTVGVSWTDPARRLRGDAVVR